MYITFYQRIQSAAVYCDIRKIVTIILLHLGVLLIKCTLHQHSGCNISHDKYLSDAFRSTKQFKVSILPKDTNTLTLAELGLWMSTYWQRGQLKHQGWWMWCWSTVCCFYVLKYWFYNSGSFLRNHLFRLIWRKVNKCQPLWPITYFFKVTASFHQNKILLFWPTFFNNMLSWLIAKASALLTWNIPFILERHICKLIKDLAIYFACREINDQEIF